MAVLEVSASANVRFLSVSALSRIFLASPSKAAFEILDMMATTSINQLPISL